MIPGAKPKETMSDNESNCSPKALDTFSSLAAIPSKKSHAEAIMIK